jgi:hypothetical protein
MVLNGATIYCSINHSARRIGPGNEQPILLFLSVVQRGKRTNYINNKSSGTSTETIINHTGRHRHDNLKAVRKARCKKRASHDKYSSTKKKENTLFRWISVFSPIGTFGEEQHGAF